MRKFYGPLPRLCHWLLHLAHISEHAYQTRIDITWRSLIGIDCEKSPENISYLFVFFYHALNFNGFGSFIFRILRKVSSHSIGKKGSYFRLCASAKVSEGNSRFYKYLN